MKYNSVKEWLEGEPLTYDFVEDTIPGDSGYCELTKGFGRFFIYRGGGYDKRHNTYLTEEGAFLSSGYKELAEAFRTRDPDSNSNLLKSIYRRLWPVRVAKARCSDTMTSAQTLLGKAVGLIFDECKYSDIYTSDPRPESIESNVGAYAASNVCIALFANDMDDDRLGFHSVMKKNYPLLEGFVSAYHSIGNYCPVPEGFNMGRGKFPYDFWDLTLELIREFYYTGDGREKRLFTLLHNNPIAKRNAIDWLAGFGEGELGWINFVDTMLMQDYVDSRTYEVLPLWPGHTWDNAHESLKKMTKEDVEIAAGELIGRITKRGKRIVSKIKEGAIEVPIDIEGFDLNEYKISTRLCREYRIDGKTYLVISDVIEGKGEEIVLVGESGGSVFEVVYAELIDYIGDNDLWAISGAMYNSL